MTQTQQTTVLSPSDVSSQASSCRPTDADELPVEFFAEMRVHAVEPVTGAEVEFGYSRDDVWIPERFGEGPSLLGRRDQLESWLMHPETLAPYDGPMDLDFSRQCIDETIQRCLLHARDIVMGARPVPTHPIEVWPINGQLWRVEPGERIPPGVTHIRAAGHHEWHEVTRLSLARQRASSSPAVQVGPIAGSP